MAGGGVRSVGIINFTVFYILMIMRQIYIRKLLNESVEHNKQGSVNLWLYPF